MRFYSCCATMASLLALSACGGSRLDYTCGEVRANPQDRQDLATVAIADALPDLAERIDARDRGVGLRLVDEACAGAPDDKQPLPEISDALQKEYR